jgi:hypothetical protein
MGNNQEIRQRLETYRSMLLVFNWIVAVVIFIVGIVLADSRYTQGIGVGLIIGSIVIGVIGHFLTNVALAIPFILLNNGDYLAAIVPEGKQTGLNEGITKKKADISSEKPIVEEEFIVTQKTVIRKGPSEDELNLGVIHKDEIVKVIKTKDNWLCFIQENGHEGWIHSSFLNKIQ